MVSLPRTLLKYSLHLNSEKNKRQRSAFTFKDKVRQLLSQHSMIAENSLYFTYLVNRYYRLTDLLLISCFVISSPSNVV